MSIDSRRPDDLQLSDATLVELISRGSVPAFDALFTRTLPAARAVLTTHLPGADRAGEVLAASYVEVWWLAGCHRAPEVDVTTWITGIVRRRAAELPAGEGPRPSYAELEFAAILRRSVDRDVIAASARAGSPDR
jgi:hypothetical protein